MKNKATIFHVIPKCVTFPAILDNNILKQKKMVQILHLDVTFGSAEL